MWFSRYIRNGKKRWKRFKLSREKYESERSQNVAGVATRKKTLNLDAKLTFLNSGPPLYYTHLLQPRFCLRLLRICSVALGRWPFICTPPAHLCRHACLLVGINKQGGTQSIPRWVCVHDRPGSQPLLQQSYHQPSQLPAGLPNNSTRNRV